ncbi:anti-sigma B factor antagonist [Serratia fonticola]|jgi:anti-sigma B factor antagonist|uniref:Anti-sigma factor antagonist n=1 Tax=Serratia fonticola TaxID=47917 RepID=A0A542BSZ2_SERFO|nr:STAS domain-containing protein [Serratia fonticola]TQI81704.1 anti-sigma B factor antagonist [Serratia fonticola]TQI96272.1 anti-sigma B factor antagonist [Serratia fonticola]TVZ70770.1 anti-sigma B factor antagonist [Serratia fonticola]
MNFEIQTERGIEIIAPLVRRLDASVVTVFKQEILSFIQQGKNCILLDFRHVEFIDSSCLGALVSILKTLNGRGDLALCALNSNIQNMFKLTRMDRIFTIGSDRDAALDIMSR